MAAQLPTKCSSATRVNLSETRSFYIIYRQFSVISASRHLIASIPAFEFGLNLEVYKCNERPDYFVSCV